jgi:hypothetical protein
MDTNTNFVLDSIIHIRNKNIYYKIVLVIKKIIYI